MITLLPFPLPVLRLNHISLLVLFQIQVLFCHKLVFLHRGVGFLRIKEDKKLRGNCVVTEGQGKVGQRG